MTEPDERARTVVGQITSHRVAGWRVLQQAWAEPTAQLVTALRQGQLRAELERSISWLDSDRDRFEPGLALLASAEQHAAAGAADHHESDLAGEHARMFGGPIPLVPLRESAYVPEGEAVVAPLAELYRTHGVPEPAHGLAPDHLQTQLSAMIGLVEAEGDCWRGGDVERAKTLRVVQQELLRGHLGRYLPGVCQRVATISAAPTYRGVAGLLSAHLSVEAGVDYGRDVLSQVFSPNPSPPSTGS